MIPLRDNIPARTTPVVNYALMIVCVLVFLMQSVDTDGTFTLRYSMIPQRISKPDQPVVVEDHRIVKTPFGVHEVNVHHEVPPLALPAWTTAITCIFLHGSFMHLLGNMWFLYIFGDNVEDRLGHWGYLIFYLGCGIAASFAHYLFEVNSDIPTLGASGAIAGVMGAYLLLYPHANVMALVPLLFILQMMVIPAPVFLGLWFVMQLLQGTFSVGATEAAGVAWWAHIGGFVAGFAVAWLLNKIGQTQPRVIVVRPGTDRRFNQIRFPWD